MFSTTTILKQLILRLPIAKPKWRNYENIAPSFIMFRRQREEGTKLKQGEIDLLSQ